MREEMEQILDYLIQLNYLVKSAEAENAMLDKISISGNREKAREIHNKWHSASAFTIFKPLLSTKERIESLQSILNYFCVEYPEPPDKLKEILNSKTEKE